MNPARRPIRISGLRALRGASSKGYSKPTISKTNPLPPLKTPKGIREHDADELRKAKRLDPIRKSGKERHSLYRSIDEEDDENLLGTTRRESVLDYLDEGDDEEE